MEGVAPFYSELDLTHVLGGHFGQSTREGKFASHRLLNRLRNISPDVFREFLATDPLCESLTSELPGLEPGMNERSYQKRGLTSSMETRRGEWKRTPARPASASLRSRKARFFWGDRTVDGRNPFAPRHEIMVETIVCWSRVP